MANYKIGDYVLIKKEKELLRLDYIESFARKYGNTVKQVVNASNDGKCVKLENISGIFSTNSIGIIAGKVGCPDFTVHDDLHTYIIKLVGSCKGHCIQFKSLKRYVVEFYRSLEKLGYEVKNKELIKNMCYEDYCVITFYKKDIEKGTKRCYLGISEFQNGIYLRGLLAVFNKYMNECERILPSIPQEEEEQVEKKELETTSIFKPTLVERIFVNTEKKTVAIKFKDGTTSKSTKQTKAKKFDEWDVFTTFAIAYTKRFCNMTYFLAKVTKQLSKKGNDKFEM